MREKKRFDFCKPLLRLSTNINLSILPLQYPLAVLSAESIMYRSAIISSLALLKSAEDTIKSSTETIVIANEVEQR